MITTQEIKSKQGLIVEGMEFYIPNHQNTALIKVVVTKRTDVDKTSCWGDYQQDVVFYEEVAQASKRKFVNQNNTSYPQFGEALV
jgi:hypothetical protein